MTTRLRERMRPRIGGTAALLCLLSAVVVPSGARADDEAAATAAAAKTWFQDARFGLFIHWGVYSVLGKGEWVMEHDKLPIAEYEKLPARFRPTQFDAEAWAKLAKAAGVRYVTITSKHHDGFCMFDSKLTDYDVVDASPHGKDPLRALADALRKQHIKLFFYYSLLDWHHPDYHPLGKTGRHAGREDRGDWSKYVAYYQGQLRELCTNYGEIGGIWFDGWWDRPDADWDLEGAYRLIHQLQPAALVGNNHHVAPFPGEDFQMFEQDLPGENSAGFNKAGVASGLPLETCLTMNRSWGYNRTDDHYKSPEEIIHALAGAAGRGANLLLNVGPRPDGAIGPEFAERLTTVGRWLEANGTSIYATRRGPIPPQPWGVSTLREGRGEAPAVFLHVLKPDARTITLPEEVVEYTAIPLGETTPLKRDPSHGRTILEVPVEGRPPYDAVIILSPPAPDAVPKAAQ